jgi:hypothetical protein
LSTRRWVNGGVYVVVIHGCAEVVATKNMVERDKRERENCRLKEKKTRERSWFFVNFALDFLHAQGMESNPIYSGWKRNILSLTVPNLGP